MPTTTTTHSHANTSTMSTYVTLPFTVTQNLQVFTSIYSNYSIPVCMKRENSDNSYSLCDCEIDSYSNTTAVFKCPQSMLCPLPAYARHTKSLFSADSDAPTSSPLPNVVASVDYYNIVEYSALVQSISGVFVDTLSTSAFLKKDPRQALAVMAIVITWLLILVVGLVYFQRWDSLDRQILFYVPVKRRQRRKTIEELIVLRRSIDDSFMTGAIIPETQIVTEEHVDYECRMSIVYLLKLLSYLLCCCFCVTRETRSKFSLQTGGNIIPRYYCDLHTVLDCIYNSLCF
jgi:hypothetical protein